MKQAESQRAESRLKIIEVFGGIVFAVVAVAFSEAGFHVLALISCFISIQCALVVVYHHAGKSKFKHAGKLLLTLTIFNVFIFSALVLHKISSEVEYKPHFDITLQVGNSPENKILLTNDFLHLVRFKKVKDLQEGKALFNSQVKGGLIIPLHNNETNIDLTFTVGGCPVDARDLQAAVSFPNELNCKLDTNKWQKLQDEFLVIPNQWEFTITNVQSYIAEKPGSVLYAGDKLTYPTITISCNSEVVGSTYKGSYLGFMLKTAKYEDDLEANVLFVPDDSNKLKPFVTDGEITADGLWHPKMSQEEFERTQK